MFRLFCYPHSFPRRPELSSAFPPVFFPSPGIRTSDHFRFAQTLKHFRRRWGESAKGPSRGVDQALMSGETVCSPTGWHPRARWMGPKRTKGKPIIYDKTSNKICCRLNDRKSALCKLGWLVGQMRGLGAESLGNGSQKNIKRKNHRHHLSKKIRRGRKS